MSRRWLATVSGPLAQYAPGFAEDLVILGYSKSAAKKQMQLLAHLDHWLEAEGRGVGELTTDLVEPLFAARRREGRSNLLTTKSLKPLLGFLRRAGIPEPPMAAPTDPVELMVDRYRRHLVRERGLVEGTVHFYTYVARLFLLERSVIEGAGLADLDSPRCDRVHRAGVRREGAVFGPPGSLGIAFVPSLAADGGFDAAGA
jgi:hypothetical protein